MRDSGDLERMKLRLRMAFESYAWMSEAEALPDADPVSFVYFAKQELLRIIVDVQQNRNRPEDLP